MAADLYLHVFEGITEDHLAMAGANTLGSKHFDLGRAHRQQQDDTYWAERMKVYQTPNVWIGEVSWLKAALFEDGDAFVPDAVGTISELVGEDLPVLTEELAGRIVNALRAENATEYSVTDADTVQAFLTQHMGKRLYTTSQ